MPGTLEPIRSGNVATQILLSSRAIIHFLEVHIANADARARRCARALHAGHDVCLQRPAHCADGKIADVELGSVALPSEARVGVALCHVEGLQCVFDREVAYGHVAEVSEAAAAAVGRSALDDAGPGFDVCAVLVVVRGDFADSDVFEDFILAFELADAAERHTCGSIEGAIFN